MQFWYCQLTLRYTALTKIILKIFLRIMRGANLVEEAENRGFLYNFWSTALMQQIMKCFHNTQVADSSAIGILNVDSHSARYCRLKRKK